MPRTAPLIDAALVRRLLAAQFPGWADLPLAPVPSNGTDNAMFRLGGDMAVRLPKVNWAAEQAAKEQAWLPRLAAHLPAPVAVSIASGRPGERYPWTWSVCRWIPGETVQPGAFSDEARFATELGAFIAALRAIPAEGGPAPGAHNFWRGAPLASRDRRTRAALEDLEGEVDASAALAVWEAALAAPSAEAHAWIHGDLQGGNLLSRNGGLGGVIDFGGLGVGDPACDLIPAWNLFSAEGREAFRARLSPDGAAWARGRGWAVSTAAIWLQSYRERMPAEAPVWRRALGEVLVEEA